MKNFKINEAEVEQKSDLLFEYRPQTAFIRASRIANEQIANEQIASIGGAFIGVCSAFIGLAIFGKRLPQNRCSSFLN